MKKIVLLTFGLSSMLGYSQDGGNNELNFNISNINWDYPELSYERILSTESAVGLAAAFSTNKPETSHTRYTITTYYRMYFGEKKASGFFIEGNIDVVHQDVPDNFDKNLDLPAPTTTTNFGYGAVVGSKFLNKHNFVGEIYLGAIRLVGVNTDTDFRSSYPRLGFTIGKRF